jgi:hypothetical protein
LEKRRKTLSSGYTLWLDFSRLNSFLARRWLGADKSGQKLAFEIVIPKVIPELKSWLGKPALIL